MANSQNRDAYKIGVVGVGRMGANIARHLKDEGFDVTVVYDVANERAEELATEIGATATGELAKVTSLADYIITVVTDDAAMRTIFAEDAEDSLLQGAAGTVFINCATLSPQVHVDVEHLAAKHGAESLEGCMASSITQAREGTLYLMCGGKKETFDKAHAILDSMSISLRYIGEAWTSSTGQSTREHGHEHQHCGTRRRARIRCGTRLGSGNVARGFCANGCKLAGLRNRWRRYGGTRS